MNERKIASTIADTLNVLGVNPAKVAQELTKEHKSLQNTFMQVCCEYIKQCAGDNYSFDERNYFNKTVACYITKQCPEL